MQASGSLRQQACWPLRRSNGEIVTGARITRHEDEFERLFALLRAEGVRRYAEIGARDGNTLFKVLMALEEGALGVAVDLPGGRWGWADSQHMLAKTCERLRRRGRSVEVVLGDSGSPETIAEVARHAPYDAVLIDGDHSYDAARADWLAYAPLSRIVAFHDISPGAHATGIEIPRLWAEIKADPSVTRVEEIIGRNAGAGVGVVWRKLNVEAGDEGSQELRHGRIDLKDAGHRRKGPARGRKLKGDR